MKNTLALILFIVVISCTKEENNTTSYKEWIISGDTTSSNNLLFKKYNQSVVMNGNGGTMIYAEDSIKLDIDEDGLLDIKFSSGLYDDNFGDKPYCYLQCLRKDVKISTIIKLDTIFTISKKFSICDDCDSIILMERTNKIKSDELNNILKFEIDTNCYPQLISIYDTIDFNKNWISSKLNLYSYESQQGGPNLYGYSDYFADIELGFWNNISGYIGVMITKDTKNYYGWINISISNKNNLLVISSNIVK